MLIETTKLFRAIINQRTIHILFPVNLLKLQDFDQPTSVQQLVCRHLPQLVRLHIRDRDLAARIGKPDSLQSGAVPQEHPHHSLHLAAHGSLGDQVPLHLRHQVPGGTERQLLAFLHQRGRGSVREHVTVRLSAAARKERLPLLHLQRHTSGHDPAHQVQLLPNIFIPVHVGRLHRRPGQDQAVRSKRPDSDNLSRGRAVFGADGLQQVLRRAEQLSGQLHHPGHQHDHRVAVHRPLERLERDGPDEARHLPVQPPH